MGKKHGKGNEYDGNILVYQGSYNNGKRWEGIGKEYNSEYFSMTDYIYVNGDKIQLEKIKIH